MPDEPSPNLPSLVDLLSEELNERLATLPPGIAWALDSLAVSFSSELEQLDSDAREAFARMTLAYGEHLSQFMSLAQERVESGQGQERERKMELLRQLPLFDSVNAFDLGQIASAFQTVTFAQGDVLAEQGSAGEAVYFLEHGSVGIIVDGNQVAIRGPGALFGETSVVTNEPVNATLKAVTRCTALRISRADFVRHVLGLPELVPRIARIGFERLEEATQRLSEVLSHMPDALLKIDREGMIAGDISSKCFTYLDADVLTGKRLSAVLFRERPELQAAWDRAFPQLWEAPQRFADPDFAIPRSVDFALKGKGLRHYEVNLVPCYRRGQQEGFDVAISDVTERKLVEAERERMQRALQGRRHKFMLFLLGGERYGVEIERVREIIEVPAITRLPGAPPYLRGFFNLRGHILPALDLYALLHLPRPDEQAQDCVFVVELQRGGSTLPVGLLTDTVDEILDVEEAAITPASELALHLQEEDFLLGIAHSEAGDRLLLDVDGLITREQHDELARLQSEGDPRR